jgi:hypothetical protein
VSVRARQKSTPTMIPLGNKLLAALVASMFALGSVAVIADDQTSAQLDDKAKLKAEKDAAKASAAKMTPQEKAAARNAKRAKKQQEASAIAKEEASAIAKEADTGNKMGQQQKDEADAGAAKAQPKALPEARPPIGVPLDRRYR